MIKHQGSSSTSIFVTVKQLTKRTELLAYKMTLIYKEVRTLHKANEALIKRRRAKKTRIRARGAFSIQNALDLIE